MEPQRRFDGKAEAYARARPGYAPEAIDLLVSRVGSDACVADIGSGTGLLTRQLIGRFRHVYAVEPNADMRTAAEASLSGLANWTSVDGLAERSGLEGGGVGLVTAAQAFHWFEPIAARLEIARILQPGGYVALLWNDRQKGGHPVLDGFDECLRWASDRWAAKSIRDDATAERRTSFFQGLPLEHFEFEHFHPVNADQLHQLASSRSYYPQPDGPGYQEAEDKLSAILSPLGEGTATITYKTIVELALMQR